MWGSGGIAPPFFTLALYEDEWSSSRPGRFTPGGKSLEPIGQRLGGPWSWSGHSGVQKNLLPLPGIDPPGSRSLYRLS
jgi:hypothetical protein